MKKDRIFVVLEEAYDEYTDIGNERIVSVCESKEEAVDMADLLQWGGYEPWYEVKGIPYRKGKGRVTYIPVIETGCRIIVLSAFTNKVKAEKALRKAGGGYIDRW